MARADFLSHDDESANVVIRFGTETSSETDGTSLYEKAYNYLREQILTGHFPPEHKVVENEICSSLGISRTPVREAILRLVNDGLVVSRPKIGTFVASINPEQVRSAQFIREKLECGLISSLVERWSRTASRAAFAVIDRQRVARAECNIVLFHQTDEDFHMLLAGLAGYPEVWKTILLTKVHLDRVRIDNLHNDSHMELVIDDHSEIVKALEKRDSKLVKVILRSHLRRCIRGTPQ